MRGLPFSLALNASALLAPTSVQAHMQQKLPTELKQALQFKMPASIDCQPFARPVVHQVNTSSLPALLELKRVVADTVTRHVCSAKYPSVSCRAMLLWLPCRPT